MIEYCTECNQPFGFINCKVTSGGKTRCLSCHKDYKKRVLRWNVGYPHKYRRKWKCITKVMWYSSSTSNEVASVKRSRTIKTLATSIVVGSYASAWALARVGVIFMANPQKENGYTPIANELLEALCRLHISGNEWSYALAVIRKTYGYNKKEDWVTNSQIATLTGMNRVRVSEAKKKLVELQIVTENRNKIALQKDYTKWGKLRKTVTIVTENRNSPLRKTVHTKDNITKDNNYPAEPETSMYEIVPDLEGEKKPKSVSRSKDIESVFRLFNNPAWQTWKLRPIEREAARVLYDTFGIEVLSRRLAIIEQESKKGDPHFPLITTPSQLLDKMPNVERYLNVWTR